MDQPLIACSTRELNFAARQYLLENGVGVFVATATEVIYSVQDKVQADQLQPQLVLQNQVQAAYHHQRLHHQQAPILQVQSVQLIHQDKASVLEVPDQA